MGGPFGPYRQSERAEHYKAAAADLVARGHAYPCFCTEERLEGVKAGQRAAKLTVGYDRHCRMMPKEDSAARLAAGDKHVVRLAMPPGGTTVIRDKLRGEVVFENSTIDDQVLLKSDGFPTYHLANVVDDHLMQITHVIRAEEWISSTPKHIRLYEAFGWRAPEWIHMPLLRNADKSKISKRKNPVSLDYYRDAGFLPEALLNFLGNLGFSIGGDREKFTPAEMIADFDWNKISLGGPVFDLAKLTNLNGLYIRDMSVEDLLGRLRSWRLGDDYLRRVLPLVHQRIERLDQFVPGTEFFFSGDIDFAPIVDQLVPKGRAAADTATVLAELIEVLDNVRPWGHEQLEPACRTYAEKVGWKTKELFMAIRMGTTGRAASPPLFDTMAVLGKEVCRRRLRGAAEALRLKKA